MRESQAHRNVATEGRKGVNRKPPKTKARATVKFQGKIRGRRKGKRA